MNLLIKERLYAIHTTCVILKIIEELLISSKTFIGWEYKTLYNQMMVVLVSVKKKKKKKKKKKNQEKKKGKLKEKFDYTSKNRRKTFYEQLLTASHLPKMTSTHD